MARSSLDTKFTIHTVSEFEKRFKEQYKNNNGEKFKGNVLVEITLGVINKKKLPEVSDVITLIKLGNIKITDEQAESILERYLEIDGNNITTAFCDLCNDLTIDIPLNNNFVEQIKNLPDTIAKQQEAMNGINNLLSRLSNLSAELSKGEDNKEVDDQTVAEG